MKGFKQGGQMS